MGHYMKKNNLNDLIGKSVNQQINKPTEAILTNQLIKNADKAMGLGDNEETRKVSTTKNLTFTFGIDEVDNITAQVSRFGLAGKTLNKSEIIRIGLKLLELTPENELANLVSLITKHPKGRQS
jgi:hypothetical protein